MDTVQLIITVALVLAALVGGTGTFLLRRRSRPERPARIPEGGAPSVLAPPPTATDVEPADQIPLPSRPADVPAPAAPGESVEEAPAIERPAPAAGRLARLRARLARSNTAFGRGLLDLLSGDRLDEAVWEQAEETLLLADLGVGPATELIEALRGRVAVLGTRDPAVLQQMLREELLALVDPPPGLDRSLAVEQAGRPAVVLVVGVNGTGKTTTVGKLARVLVAEDRDVVLGAADTFRAAAADQLETWGARVGVPTVRSDRDGADPASVAFDAVRAGATVEADVVLIDTAGRLQNKAGLMDELGKIKRVVEKQSPVDEVLLVLDATTGQNGMQQARVFSEVVNVTGIVLTKLDGTAKGGIVVAVQRALGVPVKLVGLGEGPDDLAPFDPAAFVDALVS